MDNIQQAPICITAPAAIVVVRPGHFFAYGTEIASIGELFKMLKAHQAQHLEMQVAPDVDGNYERAGMLIFALYAYGWRPWSAGSMLWTFNPAAPPLPQEE
ncbi:hypothetical protein PO883_17365 [Massilia sp. DJPM01]|uniref:hypothetical protein n=1 Tax=Massilia sp. DJPM01 TaxID=3024404 RepID=UPI00259E6169|nr:hypothetical protein [Massilia sp. DJPM01]MDM5178973.1 hypothetical protein [Massilia sp. DJPM01]